MTKKQQRKLAKCAHIALALKTQNAWIEDAFCVEAMTRRERDRLFAAASEVLHRARQIIPTGGRYGMG